MHYEILGDPIFRERDVPRMLELATARADGDTSVPDELRQLSGAQPRRARQLRVVQLIRYHAAWILPIAEPPIRDGWVAVDRGRIVAVGARDRRRAGWTARDDRSRRASPSCPASSTRTRISSCRTCATKCRRRRRSSTWIRGVMAARREQPGSARAGDPRRASTRAIAEADRVRHGARRRHQQHAGDVRAARARARSRRSCSTS